MNQRSTPITKAHGLSLLMAKLLASLGTERHARRPAGVGQKTVNIAVERGYIESIRSSPSAMPDLHRLTAWGRLALQEYYDKLSPERVRQLGLYKDDQGSPGGSMSRRVFYRIENPDEVLRRATIIEAGPTSSVYCPPDIASGPWLEEMRSFDAALDLAALLAREIGQEAVLVTRDTTEWWLNGLALIGDADERYRQENPDDI